ncbi:hypothetical protein HDU97_005007 [Phlyctochytrium planicorne]|nr:hypothetical protein HDU97_005007 [Phlyctochytrium planicorne]
MTDDLVLAKEHCRNLSPRKTPRERSRAAKALISLLESEESSLRPVDIILADAVPALLHAAQTPKRTFESLQPDPSVTPIDVIEMSDTALMLLESLCSAGVRTLKEAGWHVEDDGTGRGRPLYVHPASGVSQETPPEDPSMMEVDGERVLEENQKWALHLLFELSVLTTPLANPLDGTLMWPARIRYHDPGSEEEPRRPALTVVDVVQDDEEEQEGDEGAVPYLATTRHLVLGPWQGINGFRETEIDLDAPPGFHLESWYTCALCVVGFLATKVPGRGRVLILGLGGGAMPAFFSLHWPGISVEAVDNDPTVAKLAERWFGLSCEPPLSSADIPGFEVADDEPRMFVPPHLLPEPQPTSSSSSSADDSTTTTKDSYPKPTRSTLIRVAQAEKFCKNAASDPDHRYDAILVDVYTRSAFPSALLNQPFFDSLATLLKPHPRACVAVNAGNGADRERVEELMRASKFGSVGVLMDGAKGNLEGEYENAVVVGVAKPGPTEDGEPRAALNVEDIVNATAWDERAKETKEQWPEVIVPPFRLTNARKVEGGDGEIMLFWDGNPDAVDTEREEEAKKAKAKFDLKDVELADKDDPAFELFD